MIDWGDYINSVKPAIIQRNTISQGQTMPYEDAVLMGNFVKQGQEDIGQTLKKGKPGGVPSQTWQEGNPAVAPILYNTSNDEFRALGLAGQMALINRWANMENKPQKTVEEVLANIAEAMALNYSKEPFTLQYGTQF